MSLARDNHTKVEQTVAVGFDLISFNHRKIPDVHRNTAVMEVGDPTRDPEHDGFSYIARDRCRRS